MEATNNFLTTLNNAVVSSGLKPIDYAFTEREQDILDSIHYIDVSVLRNHVIGTIDMIKSFPETYKYFHDSFLSKAEESSDDLYRQVYLADYVLSGNI